MYERFSYNCRLICLYIAENMRREGFELSVSPPRVVYREEDGVRLEPLEEVTCEVFDEHAGEVIASLNNRKGEVRRSTS